MMLYLVALFVMCAFTNADYAFPSYITNLVDETVECSDIPVQIMGSLPHPCGSGTVAIDCNETGVGGDLIVRNYTLAFQNCSTEFPLTYKVQRINVVDTQDPKPHYTMKHLVGEDKVECDKVADCIPAYGSSDNCDSYFGTTTNVSEVSTTRQELTCSENYLEVRSWVIDDNRGHSTQVEWTIEVEDTKPPIFANPPDLSIRAHCYDVPEVGTYDPVDNCGSTTVDFAETKTGTCDHTYTLNRFWLVSDECGNSETYNQEIYVVDLDAPVMTGVNEDFNMSDCVDIDPCTPIAVDSCDGTVNVTASSTVNGDACFQETIYTWHSEDSCGSHSEQSQTITLQDTTSPTLSKVPDAIDADCAAIPTFQLTAWDNCDTNVTIVLTETTTAPNSTFTANYSIFRHWYAHDDCGNSAEEHQTVEITDSTKPIIHDVPSNITLYCDDAFPNMTNLTYSDDCCENGTAIVSQTGGEGDCHDKEYIRTWKATDCVGHVSTETQTITVLNRPIEMSVIVNGASSSDCTPSNKSTVLFYHPCESGTPVNSTSTSGECPFNQTLVHFASYTDKCDVVKNYTHTINSIDNDVPFITTSMSDHTYYECPSDAITNFSTVVFNDTCSESINLNTTFTGSDNSTDPCQRVVTRSHMAEDECGHFSVTSTQQITYIDNSDPVVVYNGIANSLDDLTIEVGNETNNDFAMKLKADFNITDCNNVTFETTESRTNNTCNEYTIDQDYYFSDPCGNNPHSEDRRITFLDRTPPYLNDSALDLNVTCANISSENDISDLFYNVELSAGELAAGGSIQSSISKFGDFNTCQYTRVKSYYAMDCMGNPAVVEQTITIVDDSPPYTTNAPNTVTKDCTDEDTYTPPELNLTDSCTLNTHQSLVSTGENPLNFHYTFSDSCGNTDYHAYSVYFEDNEAPNITVSNSTTIDCNSTVPEIEYNITNDCDSYSVEVSETYVSGCGGVGEYTQCVTAIDEAGNSATECRTVYTTDSSVPEFSADLRHITLECNHTAPDITAVDDCSSTTVAFSTSNVTENNTIIEKWIAVDECGNSDTMIRTVTLKDVSPPFIDPAPNTTSLECATDTPIAPAGFDNCSAVTVEMTEIKIDGNCTEQYDLVRTWRSVNEVGLYSAPVYQTVHVLDSKSPVWNSTTETFSDACSEKTESCFDHTTTCFHTNQCQTISECTAYDECGNSADAQNKSATNTAYKLVNMSIIGYVSTDSPFNGIPFEDVWGTDEPHCGLRTNQDSPQNIPTETNLHFLNASRFGFTHDSRELYGNFTDCDGSSYIQPIENNYTFQVCVATNTTNGQVITGDVKGTRLGTRIERSWKASNCSEDVLKVVYYTIKPYDWSPPSDEHIECFSAFDQNDFYQVGGEITLVTTDCGSDSIHATHDNGTELINDGNETVRTFIYNWTHTTWCDETIDAGSSTVTIGDFTPPSINYLADATYACIPSDNQYPGVPDNLNFTDPEFSDNCEASLVTESSRDGTCYCNFTLTYFYEATDTSGHTNTSTRTITVKDVNEYSSYWGDANDQPKDLYLCEGMTVPPAKTMAIYVANEENSPYPCETFAGDQPSVDSTTFCDVDYTEATSGSLIKGENITTIRTWSWTEGCVEVTHVQTISITDCTPPILYVPDLVVACDSNLYDLPDPDVYIINSTTADDNSGNLTFELSYNSTYVAGDCLNNALLIRTWIYTDIFGNLNTTLQTITVADTLDPTLNVPSNNSAYCEGTLVAGDAYDNCEFFENGTNITTVVKTVTEVPEGDWTFGMLHGYAKEKIVSVNKYHFQSSDNCSNTAFKIRYFTIYDDVKPVVTYGADTTSVCEMDEPVDPVVEDCSEYTIVVNDNVTRNETCYLEYTREYIITDIHENSVTSYLTMTVEENKTLTWDQTPPSDTFFNTCEPRNDSLTASGCLNSNIAATYTDTEVIVEDTANSDRYIVRVWHASICDAEISHTQTLQYIDIAPPLIADLDDETQLYCNMQVNKPDTSDQCNQTTETSSQKTRTPGCNDNNFVETILWTTTDLLNNLTNRTNSSVQVLTVYDNSTPSVEYTKDISGAFETIECTEAPSPPVYINTTDSCGQELWTMTYVETWANDTNTPYPRNLSLQWTHSDGCDTSNDTYTISLVDTTGPNITGRLDDETFECTDKTVSTYALEADACDNFTLSESITDTPGRCYSQRDYSYFAVDSYGREDSDSYLATIKDTIGVQYVIDGVTYNSSVNASAYFLSSQDGVIYNCTVPASPVVTIKDVCQNETSLTYEESESIVDANFTDHIREWSGTDGCVTSSIKQVVRVADYTPIVASVADKNISCNETFPAASDIRPAVTDDCGYSMVITEVDLPGCLGSDTKRVYTWEVIDSFQSQTTSATYTRVDVTPPSFSNQSQFDGETYECQDDSTMDNPTVTEVCGTYTVTFGSTTTLTDVGYVIVKHWLVTDTCGMTDDAFQTIVVRDSTKPNITVPESVHYECEDPPAKIANVTDNCGNVTMVYSYVKNDCPNWGVTHTWTATDSSGNSNTASVTDNIDDTAAPYIVNYDDLIHDDTYECMSEVPRVAPVFNDTCDESLEVSFTETARGYGNMSYIQCWIAVDDCGNSIEYCKNMTSVDTTPPILTYSPPHKNMSCDNVNATEHVSGYDNCTLDTSTSTSSSTSKLNGTCDDEYTIFRDWYVYDAAGNSITYQQTISVYDDAKPVITVGVYSSSSYCNYTAPSVNVSDNCDDVKLVVTVTDDRADENDYEYNVTFDYSVADACGNRQLDNSSIVVTDNVAPVWNITAADNATYEVNCTNGALETHHVTEPTGYDECGQSNIIASKTTIPGCGDGYVSTYSWSLVDGSGNVAEDQMQVITYEDTTPPVLVGNFSTVNVVVNSGNDQYAEDFLPEVDVTYTSNNCGPLEIKMTEESLMDDCLWTVVRTYHIEDDCGLSDTKNITFTAVDTTPPEFNINPSVNATYECDTNPIPCEPSVVGPDASDGSDGVTFTQLDVSGGYIWTWAADDCSGNPNQIVQTIFIEDTTPPVFTRKPVDRTEDCDCEDVGPWNKMVIDNCDANVTIEFSEVKIGDDNSNYTLVRTWYANDNADNIVSHSQTISVYDHEAPQLQNIQPDATVSCDDVLPMSNQAYALDNCDGIINATVSEVSGDMGDKCMHNLTRSWHAIDNSGQTDQKSQVITLIDEEGPYLLPPHSLDKCVTLEDEMNFEGHESLFAEAKDNCKSKNDITVSNMQSSTIIGSGDGTMQVGDKIVVFAQLSDGCKTTYVSRTVECKQSC